MIVKKEMSLCDFPFYGTAEERARMLTVDQFDALERCFTNTYGESMYEHEVNELFENDPNALAELLGYEDWEALQTSVK